MDIELVASVLTYDKESYTGIIVYYKPPKKEMDVSEMLTDNEVKHNYFAVKTSQGLFKIADESNKWTTCYYDNIGIRYDNVKMEINDITRRKYCRYKINTKVKGIIKFINKEHVFVIKRVMDTTPTIKKLDI